MYTYKIEMVTNTGPEKENDDVVIITRDKWCETLIHTHEFIEIAYIIAGNGIQKINGKDYPVQRGDVAFINIGDFHGFSSNNGMQVLNCIFMPSAFHGLMGIDEISTDPLSAIPKLMHLPSNSIMEVENLLLKIETENEEKQLGYQAMLKNYSSILITLLLRFARSEIEPKTNAITSAILDYLEENFVDATLASVSQHFNFSPSYFSKLFKKNVGISFSKHITDRRMRATIHLITSTDETISSILKAVGFTEPKQFYKVFRDYTGTSPAEYRKGYRKSNNTSDADGSVYLAIGYDD